MKSYFTIKEFEHSDTATKLKINNTAPEKIKINIQEFITELLNPLREAWGSPIIVSSGYRCEALNKAVGGAKTSSHMYGYGVDLVPSNGKIDEFIKFTQDWIKDKNFDQCIDEKNGNTKWCHIGYKRYDGQQRKQLFKIEK